MIKYCDNKDHIVALWSEAFGDCREDIEFFVNNVKNAKCLVYYDGDAPASMMYLVDCVVSGEKLCYIYAACTANKYRNAGLMSELIKHCLNNGIKVCLIPASDTLIEYYSKRGISESINIDSIIFDESDEIIEYLFDGYNLSNPMALRS